MYIKGGKYIDALKKQPCMHFRLSRANLRWARCPIVWLSLFEVLLLVVLYLVTFAVLLFASHY